MKSFRTLLLLAAFPLFFWSCDRTPAVEEPPTLPPITMEGKGTLGCLINGKLWLPNNGGFNHPRLLGIRGQNYVAFTANRTETDTSYGFSLFVRGLDSLGTFPMIASNNERYGRGGGGAWAITPDAGGLIMYFCDSILAGEITLLGLDTTTVNGRYMAGTFWMDMRNEADSTDIIQIRDGRFDVRLPN